jgi:hypothetical protein
VVLHATLVALAREPVATDDCRTQAQRRADLLHAAVTGRVAAAGHSEDLARVGSLHAPGAGASLAVELHVTIPVDTLLGGAEPGDVDTLGVLDAAAARRLVSRRDVTRTARGLVYDAASGRLCGLSEVLRAADRRDAVRVTWANDIRPATGYQHPAAMAALIRLRDRTCRHPGCTRRALACDCDHVVPYPAGPTHPDNACCLCRRHHRLKTHAPRWDRVFDPHADRLTQTTPTGVTATTRSFDYRPVPDVPPF